MPLIRNLKEWEPTGSQWQNTQEPGPKRSWKPTASSHHEYFKVPELEVGTGERGKKKDRGVRMQT